MNDKIFFRLVLMSIMLTVGACINDDPEDIQPLPDEVVHCENSDGPNIQELTLNLQTLECTEDIGVFDSVYFMNNWYWYGGPLYPFEGELTMGEDLSSVMKENFVPVNEILPGGCYAPWVKPENFIPVEICENVEVDDLEWGNYTIKYEVLSTHEIQHCNCTYIPDSLKPIRIYGIEKADYWICLTPPYYSTDQLDIAKFKNK